MFEGEALVSYQDIQAAHSGLFAKMFLAQCSIPVLEHPFDSLDLGPCDFYLFPKKRSNQNDCSTLQMNGDYFKNTRSRVKGDDKDVPSELDNGVKG
ncbi:hypothetical protein TNCV_3524851 [Trichonephila clavipes]|uniref:Uncharacterized protein n=1 Tax=Trichonephila clavipes TaxID=2585209 RepID=A0A8X6S4G5_TRICX|nr:hypothetical protein TNCV_3524851 [Trichonephila clavipes]